ncbi:MAG TPA: hypothetical protein VKZ75_01220 [Cyclobacteriaceae bacterium]|nr:hypothetical protein [Cyclobacteriaceae bacterium]
MKQLPDEIFRRRLKDHSLTPPPSAWSRVESNLPGNRRITWIKVAAAVLLLLTASALVMLVRYNNSPHTIAEQKSFPKANSPRETNPAMDDEGVIKNNAAPTEERQAVKEEAPPARPTPPINRDKAAKEELPTGRIDNHVAEITKSVPDDTGVTEPASDANTDTPTLTTAVADEPAPFKLVLEADEVQEKYLRKKSVAHATEEDNKSSGIKKLLNKANDISNQDPIGDLRQMKDDIFALNFQGKKRDQNK